VVTEIVELTTEPDPEDERRNADGDDALVWGQDVPCNRLLLLDPAETA
jgi:hypothetical protein